MTVRRSVWLVVSVLSLNLAFLGVAHAHSTLVSVAPADGARLASPPAALTLTFNERILDGTARVRLTGPAAPDASAPMVDTPVTVVGAVVTATVPGELGVGAYTVTWRVASTDGHPISGRSTFTVLTSPTPSASPSQASSTAAATPPAASTASSAPGASPSQPSTEPVDPLDPASALDGTGTGTKIAAALGAVLAAAAAIGGLLARRRAHPRRPDGENA